MIKSIIVDNAISQLTSQLNILRLQKNMSYATLAAKTGLSCTHIWRIMQGKHDPKYSTITVIMVALLEKDEFYKIGSKLEITKK